MILKKIAKLLFKFHGWKYVGDKVPDEIMRCVFVFAPHTSNWDWYFGTLCMISWGVPIKVGIKKSWMRFPMNIVIKSLGGVGIDRKAGAKGKKLSQVEALADIFKKFDKMAFVITPEGSRSPKKRWRTGFYHIAQRAEVPIVTLSCDGSKRTIEIGPVLSAKNSLDEVMTDMMKFYKKGVGIVPENFHLDERYPV